MKKKRLQKVSDNKDLSEIKTTLVLFYSEVFITRIWRLQRACKSNVLTSVTTFYHFNFWVSGILTLKILHWSILF